MVQGDWLATTCKVVLILVPIIVILYFICKAILKTTKPVKEEGLIPISPNFPDCEKLCEETHGKTWEKIHLGLGKYTYSCHICQKFRRKQ